MKRIKKDGNIEIGERLKEIRQNLNKSQTDFAVILGVSDEHYRKLESGSTALSTEKVRILYEKLCIDPSWLLVGKKTETFDIDEYLTNCSIEQRDEAIKRCLNYISIYITKQPL